RRFIFDPPAPRWWPGPTDALSAEDPSTVLRRNMARAAEKTGGHRHLAWDPAFRGCFAPLGPETRPLYAEYLRLMSDPKALTKDRNSHIKSADILDLHFDEELVDDFIGAVKALQAVSDQTVLLIAPRNLAWIQPTAGG